MIPPTLTNRERIIREWNTEVHNIIERIYKEEIEAANIESSISYLEIHQYQLNADDFAKIVGLDYAKEVLRAHLNDCRANIRMLKEKHMKLSDGPEMEQEER